MIKLEKFIKIMYLLTFVRNATELEKLSFLILPKNKKEYNKIINSKVFSILKNERKIGIYFLH